jgi:hypothetical protein
MKGYLLSLALVAFACKEAPPEPPPPQSPLALAVEEVGVTEVWLRLGLTVGATPRSVELKQNGHLLETLTLTTSDTVIITDSLLPRQTYLFTAYRAVNVTVGDSASVQLTTMDTTSHNFTWEIDTLGQVNPSALYDVALVNDTLAYAVGEVYMLDSLGNYDPLPYNLAKWNGRSWELAKVTVSTSSGDVTAPLNAIQAFSAHDIWLSSGVPIHGDGATWTQYHLFEMGILGPNDGSLTKLWGTSSSTVYFVGNKGTIVLYNDKTWQKLQSGTSSTINDIWGALDNVSGKTCVLAPASNVAGGGDKEILRISATLVDTIVWSTGRRASSVWFSTSRRLFCCGGGVFVCSGGDSWLEQAGLSMTYTRRVRGSGWNSVFVVGDFGLVAHFNGIGWRTYPEVAAALYYSCAFNGRMMIAVGERGGRAVILRMGQ